jgi:hypothetical protein
MQTVCNESLPNLSPLKVESKTASFFKLKDENTLEEHENVTLGLSLILPTITAKRVLNSEVKGKQLNYSKGLLSESEIIDYTLLDSPVKLPKLQIKPAIRIKIYEYIEIRDLILKVSKLSKSERKLLAKNAS